MSRIKKDDHVQVVGAWPEGMCGIVQHFASTADHFSYSGDLAFVRFERSQMADGNKYFGNWYSPEQLVRRKERE